MSSLVSKLICGLFDDNFNLRDAGPSPYGKPGQGHGKAMWMGFRHENGKALTMALYAPSNYVGVYVAWADAFTKIEDISGWRMASYHDSCWRTDGVERVIGAVEEMDITIFDGMRNIHVQKLPESVLAQFMALRRQDSSERKYVTREFLLSAGIEK